MNDFGDIQPPRGMNPATASQYSLRQHDRGAALQTDDQKDAEVATAAPDAASNQTGAADPAEAAEPIDVDMLDAGDVPQATGSTSAGASADTSVTVYGPRRADEDEGGEVKKINAVLDRSVPGRLMLRFLNVDMKGKGKQAQGKTTDQQGSQAQAGQQQQQEEESDDEGFQGPGQQSQKKNKPKKKNTKGKGKGKGKNRK